MAKLNKTQAKKVDDASSDFDPLEPGAYHVRLVSVDPTGEGDAGPYWTWEYDVVEPGKFQNRKLWNNTTLAAHALFGLQNTFKAFGVSTDTDTDELCGQVVKAAVSQRTIQGGARKGEMGNQIDKLMPADDDFEAPEAEESGTPDPEDMFN